MLWKIAPHRTGLALAVLCALLFGLYPPAVRAVYADGGNVAFMMLATMWARALGLSFYCLFTKKPLFGTREDRRQALIGGFLQAFSAGCVMAALAFVPGPVVIMIIFTHTLMLFFFMVWKKEVELSALIFLTTATALFGISLVLDLWQKQSTSSVWGILLAFAGAITVVMRMYVYGKQTRERNPAVVGAENFLVAALFTLLVIFFQTPRAPLSNTGYEWAMAACVAMALATFVMFFGISLLGAFSWSLFGKLEPVFTAVFSLLLIHEILKPIQYAGMALVLASLVLYQIFNRPGAVALSTAAKHAD